MQKSVKIPLIVDLDKSYLKTDLLFEGFWSFLRHRPFGFPLLFWHSIRGPLSLKKFLGQNVSLDYQQLPIRSSVGQLLRERKDHQEIILLSASLDSWVKKVSQANLGVFSSAYGSTDINLKGKAKLEFIRNNLGFSKFGYIGDSLSDLPIWQESSEIIAINPSRSVSEAIQKMNPTAILITDKVSSFRLVIKEIRLYQWVKNFLVFLPLIASHKWDLKNYVEGSLAFISFSFAASFVYVVNDLVDLSSDRRHHKKKNRPFASGDLDIYWGLLLMPVLLATSFVLGFQLGLGFTLWILIYLISNFLYSFYFKKSIGLDIILLAGMYTVRILAGGAGTDTYVSNWLLAFSVLFFFSLACVKRCTEISKANDKEQIHGRGYVSKDYPAILGLGVGSGLLSILVMALYMQSPEVNKFYLHPQMLWLVIPVLLYFVSRLWILTNRNEVHDDPVVFALKDKVSWLILLLLGAVLTAASL